MWGSASARLQGMSEARSLPAGVPDTLRFGVFAVDRKTGELRRNGVKVRLQDQPLQILLTLLDRPGEVVTREELRGRLWPGDTFVDFEHSINTAVRRLRDALGDSAENPRFVETVARRGYRFLAPVSGASELSSLKLRCRALPRCDSGGFWASWSWPWSWGSSSVFMQDLRPACLR